MPDSDEYALYPSVTRFKNDANAAPGGLGCDDTDVPSGLTRLGDGRITEVAAGVRHSF